VTPVNADLVIIEDSADGNKKKKVQSGNLPSSGSVFGQDYQRQESLGESSTISATPQDKVTLVTPAKIGTYRLAWSAMGQNGDKKSEMRLYNVTDAGVVGELQLYRVKDSTDNYPRFTAVHKIILAGAAKTFKLQWRSLDGQAAKIKDASIEFWRVS